jgi:hypothetical protein
MVSQILAATAENAAELALSENDGIAVGKDLEIIILIDVQCSAKLLGEYESAEGIHSSENTCVVHDVTVLRCFFGGSGYSPSSGISQL